MRRKISRFPYYEGIVAENCGDYTFKVKYVLRLVTIYSALTPPHYLRQLLGYVVLHLGKSQVYELQ
jgi:hypothetical protein